MSIKEVTVKVRVCDKCGKEIKGKLKTWVCPGCGKEFCYSCWTKANKPVEKRPRKKKESPVVEKSSIVLRGITWEGNTRQQAVAGFMSQIENGDAVTPEEQAQIDEFLEGGK